MALLMAGVLLLGLGCGEREDPTGPATLNITTTALPGAIAGRQYVGTLVAAGGERSYTWSVTVGGLPPGLVLHPSSGLISGTPTSIGFEDFTVEVGSGDGQSATRELMITVDPVLKPGELCSGHTGGSIAAFEDANVEAAVRSALEIGAQDDLTCGLLGTLKNLTAVNAGIVSLASIQNLTGLTTLDLPGNSITDISPLSGLTSLTVLVLGSNSITDISALTSLTSLTRIVLQDNPSLIDVQPLIDNPGLCPTHVVNLSSTNVSCADVAKLQVKGASVTSDCVSKIAFAFHDSWRQKFEIYVMDADGSNLVELTNLASYREEERGATWALVR